MSYVNNLPYFPPPPGQSGVPPPLPPRSLGSPYASSGARYDGGLGPGPTGQYGAVNQPVQYGQADQHQSAQNIHGGNSYGPEAPPLPRRPVQSLNYNQHQPTCQGTLVRERRGDLSSRPQLVLEDGQGNPQPSYAQSQVPPNYHYHPQPSSTQQLHATSQVLSHPVSQTVVGNQDYQQQQQQPVHGGSQHQDRSDVTATASYSTEQWLPAPHLPSPNQQVYGAATVFSAPAPPLETTPPAWNTSHDAVQYAPRPVVMQPGSGYWHQGQVQPPFHARGPSQTNQVPVPVPSYMVTDANPTLQYPSHISPIQHHIAPQSVDDRDRIELQRPEVQAILRQRQIELESYRKQAPIEVRQPTDYSRQSQEVEPAAYTVTIAHQQSYTTRPQASGESVQVARPSAYVALPQQKPNAEDVYYILDAGRVTKGQIEQQSPANLLPQQGTPLVIDGQVSGAQPSSRNSRTSKWVNKLNDLSAGLSKLQLQLASTSEQSSTATLPAILKPYSPQQIASTATEPIGAQQPAPQAHANMVQCMNHTSETAAALPPLESVPVDQNGLEHQGQRSKQNLGPEAWIRSIPHMTTDGPPNDIIDNCPGTRALDYKATWYHLAAVPDFLVCTRCHKLYISDSPVLTSKFLTVTLTGKKEDGETHGVRGDGNICRFNVPRLVRILIPQAKETGGMAPVEEFMRHRLTLKDCPGTSIVKAVDNIKWYGVTSMTTSTGVQLPDIWQWVVVCETCYEERVLGTHFASKFQPLQRTQPAEQEWKCDLGASSFILRSLLHFSYQITLAQDILHHTTTTNPTEENWLSLTTTTSPYWPLPACSGSRTPVEPASRAWYRADSLPSLLYCEKCYLDKIKHTAFEHYFSPLAVTSKTGSAWMDFALGYTSVETPLYTCAAQARPMLIALEYTLARRDITTFLSVAETILASPVCTDQGLEDVKLNKLTGGKWYRFASGVSHDTFRICEACHACLVTAAGGMDGFFEHEPVERAEGKRFVCSLHTGAPRGREFLGRYQEAVDVGVWGRFEGHVKVWIEIPPCPRYKHDTSSEGLRWFGWTDCLICRECWVLFCQPAMEKVGVKMVDGDRSSKDSGRKIVDVEGGLDLPVREERIADARMCCMYSPRMRGLFLAVLEEKSQRALNTTRSSTAAAPTPSSAEDALLTHARHRHAVYAATIPQVRMIQQMREMQMMASLNSGMVGLMYQGAGAMQSISGNTDGYLHGNSSIGWHETENHATSAAFFDQSRAEGAAVVGGMGGDMMRVMMLMKEWEAVE